MRMHLKQSVPFFILTMVGSLFLWALPGVGFTEPTVPSSSNTVEDQAVAPVNEVPPRPTGLHIYVNDYANLLRPSDQSTLQERLQALDEAGIAQIAVVILPNTDRDLSEFAPVILNQWDVQHYKKKDGLLVLVNAHRLQENLSGNRIFIATGTALQDRLPDALVGRVLDTQALPAFNREEYSSGITMSVLTLSDILAGDQKVINRYSTSEDDSDNSWVAIVIFIIVFLMVLNRRNRGGGGGFGGGFYGGGLGGLSGGWGGGGGGFSGGFGGGGDAGDGGGAGR